MKKIRAALRDPKTGKIFTGLSHAEIINALEDAEIINALEDGDNSVYRRIGKMYVATGSLPEAEHVGFTDGIEFLSRAQSQKKWGVFDSTYLRRVNAS